MWQGIQDAPLLHELITGMGRKARIGRHIIAQVKLTGQESGYLFGRWRLARFEIAAALLLGG